jgi:hypothetical protein
MSDSDMERRLRAARDLLAAGRDEEATVEFIWLWENMDRIEPSMDGVRVSFMAENIRTLVDRHEAARALFAHIRDRSASLADVDLTTARQRHDWMVLNDILSEPARTLSWFDQVKNDDRYATVLDRCDFRLGKLLTAEGRFADLGRLYKDPVATFVKQHHNYTPPPNISTEPGPEVSEKVRPVMRKMLQSILAGMSKYLIEDAELMVKCLVAAGRKAEADALEREARRIDPSDEMRAALERARGRLA